MSRQQPTPIPLRGGLDLSTAGIEIAPGKAIGGYNYVPADAGYARIGGYERFDGRPRPSDTPDDPEDPGSVYAVEARRAAIEAVPGSGAVNGVWAYAGRVYAVRNISGGASATMHASSASGWSSIKTGLPAGGRYQFVNHNFYGSSSQRMMYGVNGVGRAFQYDGTTFTTLTAIADAGLDKPTHVAAFKNHLFLAYPNGSLLYSGIGDPTTWAAIDGAGEIAVGDRITGLLVAQTVLVIFCAGSIHYLTGDDSANFVLNPLSADNGAKAWSAQMVNTPFYFDGGGIRRLDQTEALGGWSMAAAVPNVEPYWRNKRDVGAEVVASYRLRALDHYVLLLSDMTGFVTYLGRDPAEAMPIRLPFQARCSCAGTELGDERVFVGAENGFVYEMEAGRNFDGAAVDYLLALSFVAVGRSYQQRRWHSARIGLETPGTATLSLSCEFDFGDPDNPPGAGSDFDVQGGGGRWDVANWNEFYWSSPAVGQAVAEISGMGHNIGVAIYGSAEFEPPHTLSWMTLFSTPRKVMH